MNNNKLNLIKESALKIIKKFPVAQSWQNFLKLKNWKKLYFNIFIKKYWINWKETKYQNLDIARRIRLVEFFVTLKLRTI